MRQKLLVSTLLLLCGGGLLLWFGQATSATLWLSALAWTANASASPDAGSTAAAGSSPSDTLSAFGLHGPASCRATEPPTSSPWLAVAHTDALHYGLDPLVFEWKIWQESGFNPNVPNSPAGAIGIAQFEPGTAAGLGIDPRDPEQALDASARLDAGHLKQYADRARQLAAHYGGPSARYGYGLALAAYNAGPGAVERAWSQAFGQTWPGSPWAWLAHLGGETQRYIPNILNCTTK
jgi:soluble lytic murein transglycosylase-like protein